MQIIGEKKTIFSKHFEDVLYIMAFTALSQHGRQKVVFCIVQKPPPKVFHNQRPQFYMIPVRLSELQVEQLKRQSPVGGGFQALIGKLQGRLVDQTLYLSPSLADQINAYARFNSGSGGWQKFLDKLFIGCSWYRAPQGK